MASKVKLKNNKKGQIAIFIIIALILIVLLFILFLLIQPPEVRVLDENNPQSFVESCTRESVEDAIDILSRQGGDIKPKGFITFDEEDIRYLCYNFNFYEQCINQQPLLIEHIENEITNFIRPQVEECFFTLQNNLEKRYVVSTSSGLTLKTTLQPKHVVVEIFKDFELIRGEENKEFEKFKMTYVHPIYNLAETAMTIVNQESRYCNFDELGFMILYPQFDVKKFITGENNIIYKVTEVATDQSFTFAVRSCALPPGY